MSKTHQLLWALLMPVIVLAGIIIKMEFDIRSNPKFRIPIEGYDPRDILKGHYLQFRVKWNFDIDKTLKFVGGKKQRHKLVEAFLCSEDDFKSVYPVDESEAQGCQYRLKGIFIYHSKVKDKFEFLAGIEKFYVPEEFAKTLEDMLRQSKGEVEIAVNDQSKAILMGLYLDGQDWKELIKNKD